MIHKMKCKDAAVAGISVHARECCEHFRLPYAARLLPYGRQEVSRVHKGMNMIGCLNQDSSLPLIVWYPDGNWLGGSER